ncbi:uncharacterized protein BDZ99DRAFT_176620 [Mytilinidion resinicola]|uniref:Uncharacterized protein n=1 Tax=Mytilinidion resinicola TaxID=574789 RepID=A0A6A6Y4C0_9PEZI|nr:uncharacterized protein BDZ99DRAFT_176620 [Mytilinidion resinicola]KAF2802874.1 hypothetical protein BDZ99DRAFT_176620 [Mytilinidion resinicola]
MPAATTQKHSANGDLTRGGHNREQTNTQLSGNFGPWTDQVSIRGAKASIKPSNTTSFPFPKLCDWGSGERVMMGVDGRGGVSTSSGYDRELPALPNGTPKAERGPANNPKRHFDPPGFLPCSFSKRSETLPIPRFGRPGSLSSLSQPPQSRPAHIQAELNVAPAPYEPTFGRQGSLPYLRSPPGLPPPPFRQSQGQQPFYFGPSYPSYSFGQPPASPGTTPRRYLREPVIQVVPPVTFTDDVLSKLRDLENWIRESNDKSEIGSPPVLSRYFFSLFGAQFPYSFELSAFVLALEREETTPLDTPAPGLPPDLRVLDNIEQEADIDGYLKTPIKEEMEAMVDKLVEENS